MSLYRSMKQPDAASAELTETRMQLTAIAMHTQSDGSAFVTLDFVDIDMGYGYGVLPPLRVRASLADASRYHLGAIYRLRLDEPA